jgi:hypothetical protein
VGVGFRRESNSAGVQPGAIRSGHELRRKGYKWNVRRHSLRTEAGMWICRRVTTTAAWLLTLAGCRGTLLHLTPVPQKITPLPCGFQRVRWPSRAGPKVPVAKRRGGGIRGWGFDARSLILLAAKAGSKASPCPADRGPARPNARPKSSGLPGREKAPGWRRGRSSRPGRGRPRCGWRGLTTRRRRPAPGWRWARKLPTRQPPVEPGAGRDC